MRSHLGRFARVLAYLALMDVGVAAFTRPPLGSILADHLGRWTAFVPWFPRPLTQASPE